MHRFNPTLGTSVETRFVPVENHIRPTVSIVIPAFNEAVRIGESLRKIHSFLGSVSFSAEVIVVDDGSADETPNIVRKAGIPQLRLIRNEENHGKGYSVRQGTLAATGEYVLFTDADLSAPIDELQKLLDVATRDNADVVIGSRAVDRTTIEQHQTRYRELGGVVFNLSLRLVLGLNFQDTQCGFKLFRRDRSREIFEEQTILGFGFDPELLFLATRRGLKVREVPVRWSHSDGSKFNPLADGSKMFMDLVRIRWTHRSV